MGWLPETSGRIRREAARWVARRQGSEPMTEEEQRAFRSWHSASERHAAAYDRMMALWELSGRVTPARSTGQALPGAARLVPGRRLALAASLFALVVLGAIALVGARATDRQTEPILLASAVGEILSYTLSDGSKVVLDTHSKVRVDYSAGRRSITLLRGRARFLVARDARPFAVAVAGRELLATDSTFDVSAIGSEPAVHLLKGYIVVRGGTLKSAMPVVRLRSGDAVVLPGSGLPAVATSDRTGTRWTHRMAEFDQTPLSDAIAQANRYSPVQIRLADPALGDLKISGAFRVGNAAALARSLAVALRLESHWAADGAIVLARRRS